MCFCAWTIWYIYIYCLSCQEILVLAESLGISNRVKFNIHIPLPTVLYAYTILSHPKESSISGAVHYKCQHDVPWNPSWWSIYFIGFLDSYHTYLKRIIFHHMLHLSIHGYDTFPIIRYPSMDRSINIMISIPSPQITNISTLGNGKSSTQKCRRSGGDMWSFPEYAWHLDGVDWVWPAPRIPGHHQDYYMFQ